MNAYFEQVILSASPVELVRLMYQQAIASVSDAREHLRYGRIAPRAAAITRAYAIVAELLASLDGEKAPAIVANLRRLYVYIQPGVAGSSPAAPTNISRRCSSEFLTNSRRRQ